MQITENLNPSHKKQEFTCGKKMLDTYLHKQANQDIKRQLSACFVLKEESTYLIKGYYTLSNNSVSQELVPSKYQKKIPNSYKSVPVTLLGRLAVDSKFQGNGYGKFLLIDALKRCYDISKSIGSFAVVVDPLDVDAEKFYSSYGFVKLPDSEKMILPMVDISKLFKDD